MASQQDLHPLIAATLLSLVPEDGSTLGNTALRRAIESRLKAEGLSCTEDDYWQVHADLIAQGRLAKGQGRGGSVRRVASAIQATPASPTADNGEGFVLQAESAPVALEFESQVAPVKAPVAASKTPVRRAPAEEAAQIIAYRHPDRRVNNPEVGMVTPATDPEAGKTRWAFDPHLDPALGFDPQRAGIEALIDGALASGDADRMRAALEELKRLQSPYLNWAGKAERTSFEVDTVSLHVHERVDPASILSAVRKAMKEIGRASCRERV